MLSEIKSFIAYSPSSKINHPIKNICTCHRNRNDAWGLNLNLRQKYILLNRRNNTFLQSGIKH